MKYRKLIFHLFHRSQTETGRFSLSVNKKEQTEARELTEKRILLISNRVKNIEESDVLRDS